MYYKLLNSAVITRPGHYEARSISREEFAERLRDGFISYIGYPATADHIKRISGLNVPLSREAVALQDGDRMLVCKLKYRLSDPALKSDKGFAPSDDDYEYLLVTYHESA